ncbi:MAG TPA: tRNA pseudouridine(38-40) synthase TruA, partial [Thermodesulfobacteriota bacterium]|nr:tRNA pseudouridine(38-40) synthase TruA [Thermodesulfobacteriota bacterium]
PYPLKARLMDEAARALIGEHDFRVFAQAGATVKSTVRTVLAASVTKRRDLIEISIEADGFMKRMVRLIVGTLAQVGKEKITPSQFREILESGEKTKHVHAAPAKGLYLKEVRY